MVLLGSNGSWLRYTVCALTVGHTEPYEIDANFNIKVNDGLVWYRAQTLRIKISRFQFFSYATYIKYQKLHTLHLKLQTFHLEHHTVQLNKAPHLDLQPFVPLSTGLYL